MNSKPNTQIKSVAIAPTKAVDASPASPAVAKGFRPATYPLTAMIKVVAEANPKRPGTKAAAKWALYKDAKTVGDLIAAFLKAGYPRRRALSAIRWDAGHGFIEVGEKAKTS